MEILYYLQNQFSNKIPIYELAKKDFDYLFDYFIKGEEPEKIYYYNKNEWDSGNDLNHVFKILKLNLDNTEDEDSIENIIEELPEDELNKIKNNSLYKTNLCENYKNGNCPLNDKCDMAHGNEELNLIKKIREYLIKNNDKEGKLNKYKMNRDKAYNELKNELIDIFKIFNLKLVKRLIYDILSQNNFTLTEIKIDFEDIIYLHKTLCLEYYFNFANNHTNESLKEKLINFITRLLNYNEKDLSDNEFLMVSKHLI